MNTPGTLSYQLPGPLPPHLRRRTAAQRRAVLIATAGGAVLLLALLALVLFLATTAGSPGIGQESPTAVTTTPGQTPTPTPATPTGL